MAEAKSIHQFTVRTEARQQLVDITSQVIRVIARSGVREGVAIIYTPHTTAAVTINENADPDVAHDLLLALDEAAPSLAGFRHGEGNSAAHAKSSLVGCSETVIVESGKPVLGTWQGIYLAEFDGPRTRQVWVKVI